MECNGKDSFLHQKDLKGQCPSATHLANILYSDLDMYQETATSAGGPRITPM